MSYQIVLTKADQVKPAELAGPHRARSRRRWPSARPPSRVLATSPRDGAGIAELRAAIARLAERRR